MCSTRIAPSTRIVLGVVSAGLLASCGSLPGGPAPPAARPGVTAVPPSGPFHLGADELTVLPRGETAFPRILDLLAGARLRVNLEMYELQRADLVEALLSVHRRGVPLTVILDPSGTGSAASAEVLRGAGVEVVDYPIRRLMIDHVKLLVVDGQVAVVGGINWSDTSAAHHDFDVLARGPVAANLERVFVRDLLECGRAAAVPPVAPDANVLVASTLPFDEVRPLVMDLLEHAARTVDLELFVLTDMGVVHALERAHVRGVAVRLLLDPSQRPSDPAAAELRSFGLPVRLYASHGELLHAKAVVADGATVLFGSANWSGGGFSRNHEVDLEVRNAPAVARAFLAAVDADWAASDGAGG